MIRTLLVVAAACVLAACGGTSAQRGTDTEVENAFIVKPIDGRDMTSAGFVANAFGSPMTLVEANSEIADRVEIHTMEMTGGKMRMRRVDELAVVPGEPLKLQRGGSHLMLFGINEELTAGETVEIELRFDDDQGNEHYIAVDALVIEQAD